MNLKVMTASLALALSACSGITLTDEGEKVRVLDPGEVSSCREKGKTNNAVTAKFVLERPADVVADELIMMARNSAARMGADTIVPLTVVEKGQQTFMVYKCVDPDG